MAMSNTLVPLAFFMMLFVNGMAAIDPNWYDAHATFYGDAAGGETMRKLKLYSLQILFLNINC